LISVLDYGMGNLHSVLRAIQRVGGKAEVTGDFDTAARSDALVVPGVGAFGACMSALNASGFVPLIHDFADSARPLFGVCLGLQVLFEGSDEDPDPGMGVFPGRVTKLPDSVKVPHMGWNSVVFDVEHPYTRHLNDGEMFYFVHSYAAEISQYTVARTDYGIGFSAVVARGSVFASQFHPEKSGDAGLSIYEAFVKELP
jgi:glutamine amidotransferase